MNIIKKILFLGGLVILAVVCVLSYWNQHLVYKAQNTEDKEKRIRILEKANELYPLNPEVYYALGEAHLSIGVQIPEEPEESEAHFKKAVKNYEKYLGMNPVSAFSHFGLAQAYYNRSFFTPSLAELSFNEYRNAAHLAGHHTPIFFEVGTLFLSRWDELNEESRDFTVSLLRRIVESADRDKFIKIMQIWEMNVNDYEVMERILPEKAWVYRMYARFLGEKSLSLGERQPYLAEAEALDFKMAQDEHEQGENNYFYYQMEPAFSRFKNCLNVLKRIHFYQRLTGQNLIDTGEFEQIQKSSLLYLVKSGLELGKRFDEVRDDLKMYLNMEDKVSAVREVDEYLQRHQIIGNRLERNFEDMDLFAFHAYLSYRENRYRDIMRVGRNFRESIVVVPKDNQDEYVRILQIVGDANQKVDYIYDAVEFYEKALEVEPDNLETLVRLRESLIRLNREKEVEEINQQIEEVVSAQVKEWVDRWIEKGQNFYQNLVLDGSEVVLKIYLENGEIGSAPLVSVFWNGRVMWEDYLELGEEEGSGAVFLGLNSKVGENQIRISPVNQRVRLLRVEWEK
ncbi:MAG TPA: tetratricopeptide repeat protein [Acidobacteriota bacterium]|nr:tetratricopeptide repeat protein [Acidobacteriota bacterium]